MSLKLGHYCLSVRDLKKSCDFYGLFGFVEKHRYNRPELGIDVAYLENADGLMLELAAPHSPVEAEHAHLTFRESLPHLGYQHVGFTSDDIDDDFTRLSEKGVEFADPIATGKISRYCFCWDPDGVLVELIQYFD